MAASSAVVVLWHGTTRQRAEAILLNGPDLDFREPGSPLRAEGFSTARPRSTYSQGSPEVVARGKDQLFPNEGGPVILEIEVPEAIVLLADFVCEVRFEPRFGFDELLAAWPAIAKRILPL
jgi:hypothetical protein